MTSTDFYRFPWISNVPGGQIEVQVEVKVQRFWLAVVGRFQKEADFLKQGWWCIQRNASAGDLILGYRTSKADKINNGIFAVCKVSSAPDPKHQNAGYCSRYGKQAGEVLYTKTELVSTFTRRLSFSEMKNDPEISKLKCVHRNFQGTTFELTKAEFELILRRLGQDSHLHADQFGQEVK